MAGASPEDGLNEQRRSFSLETLTSLVHEPLEALGRLLGRRKRHATVGLALSGGAARGIAHIGVLAVLMEAGIIPDLVVGTSAGAAVGALFCRGWSPDQMLRLVRGLGLLKLGRPSLRRPGLLDGARFEEFFRGVIGDLTFADLSIPLAVVACDLRTGEEAVLREGPLAPAVRASCAIPGIFTPAELDGRLLVDGGVVHHIPIAVARNLGIDYVIGVDAHPREILDRLPHTPFDVLALSYSIVSRRAGICAGDDADCLIRPDTGRFDPLRFGSQADDLYQAGRQAAQEALSQLQRELEHRS